MKQIKEYTVRELRHLIDSKEISSFEITKAYIEFIDNNDREINTFITRVDKAALESAKSADLTAANTVLKGIPYAVKDNICTKGIRTTCASKMLEDFVPCYDATVIELLNKQGSPMLGKLNMDEFAMGNSNENSAFGPVRNPLNSEYVPGGSSGGSAAAVAAGFVPFSLGSDTGGSVRLPASYCGVVGMKPTYGAVSRYGLVAFASSLEQIGVITKNVYDNAMVMSAIYGHDDKDSTSADCINNLNYPAVENGIYGMKIAIPVDELSEYADTETKEAVLNAAKAFASLGAEVCDIRISSLKYAVPSYYIISSAEASSNLARFDGVRYGNTSNNAANLEELYINSRSEAFGAEVTRRIMLGAFVLSSGYYDEYYKKAVKAKNLISSELKNALSDFDMILMPTAPSTAFKHGEKTSSVEKYNCDIFTVPANLAGVPAMSIPCGKASNGMPIGMQLIGRPFDELTLYKAGFAYEQYVKEAV